MSEDMERPMAEIDPIRLELIKNALTMVSDNMMVSVIRTSRSTVVKANLDFSAAIFDASATWWRRAWRCPATWAP